MNTSFELIYNSFLSKITDDMYMELTVEDTYRMLKRLLISALPWFEFPRFNIFNYDEETEQFNEELTIEEINIIAVYMIVEWLGQQLASTENARQIYGGSDFKVTSQANHMAKLSNLKDKYQEKGFHLQRLYKRRKADKNGVMRSTFGTIMKERDRRNDN